MSLSVRSQALHVMYSVSVIPLNCISKGHGDSTHPTPPNPTRIHTHAHTQTQNPSTWTLAQRIKKDNSRWKEEPHQDSGDLGTSGCFYSTCLFDFCWVGPSYPQQNVAVKLSPTPTPDVVLTLTGSRWHDQPQLPVTPPSSSNMAVQPVTMDTDPHIPHPHPPAPHGCYQANIHTQTHGKDGT